VTDQQLTSPEHIVLGRALRHALGLKRWNAALLQPGGEGMLTRYLAGLYATLHATTLGFSEKECEFALVAWLDDADHDPSLDFHTYACAWRSALRARVLMSNGVTCDVRADP
jgi:hypothetical protein